MRPSILAINVLLIALIFSLFALVYALVERNGIKEQSKDFAVKLGRLEAARYFARTELCHLRVKPFHYDDKVEGKVPTNGEWIWTDEKEGKFQIVELIATDSLSSSREIWQVYADSFNGTMDSLVTNPAVHL